MNQAVSAAPALTMASRLSWRLGVRRRHVDGQDFLVRITLIHTLDAVSAALWYLIDDRRTLFEIFQQMEQIQPPLPGYQGVESVVNAALRLQQQGYLEDSDATQVDYEKQYLAQTVKQGIWDLMQGFYAHPEDWQHNLGSSDIEKIYQRFIQIFYEYEVAQRINAGKDMPARDDFMSDLARHYSLNQKQCTEWFSYTFGIRSWRYDIQENRIVIVYMDAVYSGDLDNRL